jgi:hypothetical protein
MKILILLFALNLNQPTFAKLPLESSCQKPISRLLKTWGHKGKWLNKTNGLYISSTDQFGEWILFKKENKGITLTKANQSKHIKVHFSKHKCAQKMRVVLSPKKYYTAINDKSLKDLIAKDKGIIYLWSPHMPLSYKGIFKIKKAAKKRGLKLHVFMDSSTHPAMASRYQRKYTQTIDSFELKMRNAFIHFPAVLSFENGKIKPSIKYGYENQNGYEKDIRNIFKL